MLILWKFAKDIHLVMSPKEKVAAARVISDIIKADSIIEKTEMMMLSELRKKFDIHSEHLQKGQGITFSEALSILRRMDFEEAEELLNAVYNLSISDGSCCPSEAQLILAIKYCFEKELREHAEVFSCNTTDFNIASSQYVVYVESKTDKKINEAIRSNLERIVNALKVIGFDFVYIPKLVQEFKVMSPEYVKDVINYMAPQLDRDTTVQDIYNRMCNLTTYEFCQKVLCEENKVNAIKDTAPSLLVSVGNSIVPYVDSSAGCHSYMEFLKIQIQDDVVDEIRKLCSIYQGLVDDRVVMPIRGRKDRFKYFGFYKALLDFLVAGRQEEDNKLTIDLKNRSVGLLNKYGLSLKLSPDKITLFLMLIIESIKSEGLSFSRNNNGSLGVDQNVQDLYSRITRIIKGSCSNEKYKTFFENISVTLSKLKAEIQGNKQLSGLTRFLPKKLVIKDSQKHLERIIYKVDMPVSRVLVKEYKKIGGQWIESTPEFKALENSIWLK